MPTVEVVRQIQAEHFAEDLEVDEQELSTWSEEAVHAYFASGGGQKRGPTAQDWLNALDGIDPDGADDGVAAQGSHGSDADSDGEPADASRASHSSLAGGPAQTGAAWPPMPGAEPDAPPPPPPRPSGFRKPSDYEDTSAEEVAKRTRKKTRLPGVHEPVDDDADAAEEQSKREPLPELPGTYAASGVMTVDEAYAFLEVPAAERGDLAKLKTRFRKMCLKWHPDKNLGREKQAAEAFQAVHAAYHFLTTTNFDHKKWAASFTVPPLQSLDDVLLLALSGEDPYRVEELLRKRGEFRPHKDFGVNLSIPWNAGGAEDPSYDVAAGSAYTTTRALGEGAAAELEYVDPAAAAEEALVASLASRGVDVARVRGLVSEGAKSSELQQVLKAAGLTRLNERSRMVAALKVTAVAFETRSPACVPMCH
jgi:hypothetical protein